MLAYSVERVERKWRKIWQDSGCFVAPEHPVGKKFFNFDSGPFLNGPLHLGHVRTYVLGDVIARYQRLLGKSVLYCTAWDAFGLPNELAARDQGVPPDELVASNIANMRDGLERLGISYDWARVKSTCCPSYYAYTQKLFLDLLHRGLVEQRVGIVDWCPSCATSLDTRQVDQGACWRCGAKVRKKSVRRWFVLTSRYSDRLRHGTQHLNQWSNTGRKLLERGLGATRITSGSMGCDMDWQVSRDCAWGTPVPMLSCHRCGALPADSLPVVREDSVVGVDCRQCGASANYGPDTLDCFFDDSWSYLSCVAPLDSSLVLSSELLNSWMPVDHFHSGFDTFVYLNLYRMIGHFLFDQGVLTCNEPIRRYDGHDMVTNGGRKMSKRAGNSPDVDALLDSVGMDVLRIAILWAARPDRSIDWQDVDLHRAKLLVDRTWSLTCCVIAASASLSTRASAQPKAVLRRLYAENQRARIRIARFLDQYRPNAAIEEVHNWVRRSQDRVQLCVSSTSLNSEDVRLLRDDISKLAVCLSPMAPCLAEEVGEVLQMKFLIAKASWPVE